jgi:hypothetical protein
VNAQVRVHEEWSYDNWNGGTYGHALYLVIPEVLYLSIVADRNDTQAQIRTDLNSLHNVQNEFIDEVFIEMEIGVEGDWRQKSGLMLGRKNSVPPNATARIWGSAKFRIFLSHKVEVKAETAKLKRQLLSYGASSFVAHTDIHPTKQWQDEIEYALSSMDGFVALMTPDFHNSNWTDQEVGFAFARGVPIVAVRMGLDPYGFIGKFQGLTSSWDTVAEDIVKLFINNEMMFRAYLEVLRDCPSFEEGIRLAKVLPGIEHLTDSQVDDIVEVYNDTSQLKGCFAFNGSRPSSFGPGLTHYLNNFGKRKFIVTSEKRITEAHT